MTLSDLAVLVTLTTDTGKILAKLHQVSPVSEKKVIKLAKKLKKEKVNIDIVNFGEDDSDADILNKFITTINGKEGTGSHLVTIPPGPHLSDALVSSPIVQGEDGMGAAPSSGFEFGVNPDDDPELALALRVSMEEQRARQQAEAGGQETGGAPVVTGGEDESSEEAMLQRALAMSMDTAEAGAGSAAPASANKAPVRDLSSMTEEEQIAYAMQMSMADAENAEETPKTESMDVDEKDEDYSEVMNDPAFLQSVLQNLPGVDPQSEAVRNAVGAAKEENKDKKDDNKDKDKK